MTDVDHSHDSEVEGESLLHDLGYEQSLKRSLNFLGSIALVALGHHADGVAAGHRAGGDPHRRHRLGAGRT